MHYLFSKQHSVVLRKIFKITKVVVLINSDFYVKPQNSQKTNQETNAKSHNSIIEFRPRYQNANSNLKIINPHLKNEFQSVKSISKPNQYITTRK